MSKNQSRKYVRQLQNENRKLRGLQREADAYVFPPYDCTPRRNELFHVLMLFGLVTLVCYSLAFLYTTLDRLF